MWADKRIHEGRNMVVLFEEDAPEIWKRDDGIDFDFQAAADIFLQVLMIAVGSSLVDG